jgi:hypothetical protein
MNLKYRKTIIAGNWKMNLNAEEAKKFITQLKTKAAQAKWCDVVLCVPFLHIPAAVRAPEMVLQIGGEQLQQIGVQAQPEHDLDDDVIDDRAVIFDLTASHPEGAKEHARSPECADQGAGDSVPADFEHVW